MLLSSLRRLALPRSTDFRAECPGGDGAAAAHLGAARRRARVARVARRRRSGRRPGTRARRAPLRPRGADRRARRARPATSGSTSRCRSTRRGRWCSRPAASRGASHGERGAARCARTRGARATASTSRSPAAPRLTGGMDEFYGRNMPAPPARIGEERLRPAGAALRARRARLRRGRRGVLRPGRWPGPRTTSCRRPRAGRAARLVRARRDERARSTPRVAGLREAGVTIVEETASSPSTSRPRSRTRSAACGWTTARASRAPTGCGRRASTPAGRDRRLRERPRPGARARPRGRRVDRRQVSGEVRADAASRPAAGKVPASSRAAGLILVDPSPRPGASPSCSRSS